LSGNHREGTRPVAMLRRSRTRFIDFSTPVCIITTERTLPLAYVAKMLRWREFNCRVTYLSPKHSPRPIWTSSAPDPSTNSSTIFLHQIPPPNSSTDASTICLFQLPPSCHQRLHQIPPPNPSIRAFPSVSSLPVVCVEVVRAKLTSLLLQVTSATHSAKLSLLDPHLAAFLSAFHLGLHVCHGQNPTTSSVNDKSVR
jgi:hypothetical protein